MKNAENLLGYYFGTLDDHERMEAEALLLSSRPFLEAFIVLKRNLEANENLNVLPSTALKARLRQEVQNTFKSTVSNEFEPERIPFAVFDFLVAKQAWALAAMVLVIAGVISVTESRKHSTQVDALFENSGLSGVSIDSARQTSITTTVL